MAPPRDRPTSTSPLAGMPLHAKRALVETTDKITIKWTDPRNADEQHAVPGVPKPMLLAFSAPARHHYGPRNARNVPSSAARTYDLGARPTLDPTAVRYVLGQMRAACTTRGPRELAAYGGGGGEDSVLRQLKCFVALRALGVRCAEYAWRGALMDAMRGAGDAVTGAEFVLLHRAFGLDGEPLLLRHALGCVARAELRGEVEHVPETARINAYVYGGEGGPELAAAKRAVEAECGRRAEERAERERAWRAREERRRERRERSEGQGRRRAEREERAARSAEKLDKARAGERVLSEREVEALTRGEAPKVATLSKKLR